MKQFLFFFLLLFAPITVCAQIQPRNLSGENADQTEEQEEEIRPPITDYRIISIENDTTSVDTSLTIYKDYKFNYLRRDDFGLLPFSNIGQTYNQLTYNLRRDRHSLTPEFGAQARHYNFMEVGDIYYYHVPTPFTEAYFRTVFEQGQTLDVVFTVNTSPNLNVSIAYKGLRSLGKYRNILASTGNFRTTARYETPNGRYRVKTHFVSQDLLNQENGGLQEQALEQYLSEEEEYQDRSRLDVNFTDAESTLFGKRFYLNHSFDVLNTVDSLSANRISVGHILNFSDKKFVFSQGTASELLGPAYETVGLHDQVKLEHIYNEAFVEYGSTALGVFRLKAGLTNFNYGYNTALRLESGNITNRLVGDNIAAGGEYKNRFGAFDFYADAQVGISGELQGSSYGTGISYSFGEENSAAVSLSGTDTAPNFNFLLYQSDYVNYNWQNDFSNVMTHKLEVQLDLPSIGSLGADASTISDYAYFGATEDGFVKPFQFNESVNYVRIFGNKEFRWGKFALNNTVLYQKVLEGEEVFRVPDLVTRNTLYFEDHWFRRALFLQTGFTLNYFTDYRMNAYDPVLAEFYVQNEQEVEGFPSVDFFFNGKVRQARIFFKLEHLNSLLTGNDNFSAPGYPYRDFGVRFGLVWNFFM